MSVEVLLIGAHPDDVEWGAGGITVLLQEAGVSFALLDLSQGENGSRGTPEDRVREAGRAAQLVGAAARENLSLADCRIVDSPDNRALVADVIRRYRPALVLAPFWKDRHPDHVSAGRMVRNARLFCTLKNSSSQYPPHKPKAFLYFPLNQAYSRPSFVVNISSVYERKLELIRVYESQFGKTADQFGVVSHGLGDYLFALESRDRFFGSLIGARHGEALISEGPMPLSNLTKLLTLG